MNEFAALADPTRRKIVELLAERERSAGEIVARFSVSAPAISQHLKVLREAGLVQVRVEGQHRIQVLDFRALKKIEAWVFHTQRFWEKRLDALEEELMAEDNVTSKIEFERHEEAPFEVAQEMPEKEGPLAGLPEVSPEVVGERRPDSKVEYSDIEDLMLDSETADTREMGAFAGANETGDKEGQKSTFGGIVSENLKDVEEEHVVRKTDQQQDTFGF